jgi:hypothetical protein
MLSSLRRRSLRAAFLFAIVPAIAACDDDPIEPEEDLPAEMRLTVGSQTVTVTDAGTVTGGPIALGVGAATLTAVFLDADGQVMNIPSDELELRVVPANSGIVTFIRSSAFAGTLTGITVGSTSISVSLYHFEEEHNDFGEFPVPVTVQ